MLQPAHAGAIVPFKTMLGILFCNLTKTRIRTEKAIDKSGKISLHLQKV